jgi:hypothetical protein
MTFRFISRSEKKDFLFHLMVRNDCLFVKRRTELFHFLSRKEWHLVWRVTSQLKNATVSLLFLKRMIVWQRAERNCFTSWSENNDVLFQFSWSVLSDCLSREERNCFISCSEKNDFLFHFLSAAMAEKLVPRGSLIKVPIGEIGSHVAAARRTACSPISCVHAACKNWCYRVWSFLIIPDWQALAKFGVFRILPNLECSVYSQIWSVPCTPKFKKAWAHLNTQIWKIWHGPVNCTI